MTIRILLILSTIIAYSILNTNGFEYECSSISQTLHNETLLISHFDTVLHHISKDFDFISTLDNNPVELEKYHFHYASCCDVLVRKSFYKACEKLIEIASILKINLVNDLQLTSHLIKKEVNSLIEHANIKKRIQTVTPAFEWAQHNDHIIMKVRLSHRHDSPACLNTNDTEIDIQNNSLYLSSFCTQSHNPLHFVLNLSLFDEIDPERSIWKAESVGRIFINMTKVTPKIWERLIDGHEKLPQMRIWWEMKESEYYSKDMGAFSKMLDVIEEKEACMRSKKCRKMLEAQKRFEEEEAKKKLEEEEAQKKLEEEQKRQEEEEQKKIEEERKKREEEQNKQIGENALTNQEETNDLVNLEVVTNSEAVDSENGLTTKENSLENNINTSENEDSGQETIKNTEINEDLTQIQKNILDFIEEKTIDSSQSTDTQLTINIDEIAENIENSPDENKNEDENNENSNDIAKTLNENIGNIANTEHQLQYMIEYCN